MPFSSSNDDNDENDKNMTKSSSDWIPVINSNSEDGEENSTEHLVAVLHDNLSIQNDNNNNNGCGHAFRWNASEILALHECPTCHKSVKMISSFKTSERSTKRLLCFKYGKVVFRLEYSRDTPLPSSSSAAAAATGRKDWHQWIFFFLPSTIKSSNQNTAARTVPSYLAHVLGLELEHMKILHKGKVLYPSSCSTTQEEEETTFWEISQRDEEHAASRGSYKPSLVILGTTKKDRLSESSRQQQQQSKPFVRGILLLPFQIIYYSLYGSWWLLRSFVEPFVPTNWLTHHRDHED
eukprot:scaffold12621_cov70-Cylindrotheca_fusiformis.AAC.1